MIAPARTAAFHALRAIATGRADLPAALAQGRGHLSDERDRALAAEIVTGTLRWLRALDYLIAQIADRPLAKLDLEVLTILRLSLYQILHLDRVPASAVVDDAVNLTRGARKPSAAGFVNAVLRSTLRRRAQLPLPGRPVSADDNEGAVAYLGITHSHPEWLVRRWLARVGFEAAERWVRFNNETPGLSLRANRLRITREALQGALSRDGVETAPLRYAPDGLEVISGNPLSGRRARGAVDAAPPGVEAFVVQDEASQLVPLAVAARPGERVLDLCASPGGKTLSMAADMNDTGLLVACDVRPARIDLLRHTIRTGGARSVDIVRVGVDGPLPFGQVFDRVLVDAPCSGLGTIRRDPDIRWRRTAADLPALAAAQLALLSRAAAVVRPGGRLVYATCSSEPDENDEVVDTFLRDHPEFAVEPVSDPTGTLAPVVDAGGRLRTEPFVHGLEAFFAAAMTKVVR